MPNGDAAVYNTHVEAERAVKTLEKAGFAMKKLSIGSNFSRVRVQDWGRFRIPESEIRREVIPCMHVVCPLCWASSVSS
jgi:hypothetical protein